MKIAWFTPFSRTSAIGRFSRAVASELRRLHSVDIWHPETRDALDSDCPTEVFRRAEDVRHEALSAYDCVVYNLGNYVPFHLEIYRLSRSFPGFLILHDYVMHHFFASYLLEHLRDEGAYLELIRRHYGPPAEAEARACLQRKRPPLWETDEVLRYPLFEEAAVGALGVIVHSGFFLEPVRRACACPVEKLHLAYPSADGTAARARRDPGLRQEKIIALSIGHVNRNKRILSVLRAIASSERLRSRLHYIVAGPLDPAYAQQLRQFTDDNGLAAAVEFRGFVDDATLHSLLASADFCINLRYPPTESGSASLIEQMRMGKAVVVSNSGCYTDLPENCVMKVSAENEDTELAAVLQILVEDSALREEMGARAREFAEEHFTPSRYARDFAQAVWRMGQAAPLLSVADRVSLELSRMGVTSGEPVIDRLAREMEHLFCSGAAVAASSNEKERTGAAAQ